MIPKIPDYLLIKGDLLVKMFSCFNSVNLSPELRLMLACLRILPNEKEVQQIEKLSNTKIAWYDFLRLVDRHRVAPLVFTNLNRYAGEAVPPAIMRDLRSRFESNAHRSMANASELVRLYKLFQENGIAVLPLKGSLLALQVYGNLALRHAGDIDLLVDPQYVEIADHLLQGGYRRIFPGFDLTAYQKNQIDRFFHHFEYLHDQNSIALELHWRSIHHRESHTLDLACLCSGAQYVPVAGYHLPAMSREDTILYLCAHGAGHYWFRLFWLVDLAEIMRQNQTTDWDQLMVRAVKLGIVRPLAQGVILAHMFCDVPLPGQILAYAGRDRVVTYLTKRACEYILSPLPEPQPILQIIQDKVYRLRLSSNSRDKFLVLQSFFSRDYRVTLRPTDLPFPLCTVLWALRWFHRRLAGNRGQVGQRKHGQEQ